MDDRDFNLYLIGYALGAVIGILGMSLIFVFDLTEDAVIRMAVLFLSLFIGAVFGWQLLERLTN